MAQEQAQPTIATAAIESQVAVGAAASALLVEPDGYRRAVIFSNVGAHDARLFYKKTKAEAETDLEAEGGILLKAGSVWREEDWDYAVGVHSVEGTTIAVVELTRAEPDPAQASFVPSAPTEAQDVAAPGFSQPPRILPPGVPVE